MFNINNQPVPVQQNFFEAFNTLIPSQEKKSDTIKEENENVMEYFRF